MQPPPSSGPPSSTTRVGSPAVWESITRMRLTGRCYSADQGLSCMISATVLRSSAQFSMALRNSAQERGLIAALGVPSLLEGLFNHLPNVVFFVKDREGRYVLVNETLLRRCGIASKNELLGRTAEEVFPSPLGASYTAQDRLVLETGAQIRNKLELHLYPGRKQGWCLTFKT